jgi:hypothetical protein
MECMRPLGAILLLGLLLAGCGGDERPATAAGPAATRQADGIHYVLPTGWNVARRSLTPHLVDPHELFTAGTGRLAEGEGRCAQMPSAALVAMRAHDVLVTVQERARGVASIPARPQRFALAQSEPSEADQCAGAHPAFASHLFGFRDRGRAFHALVAIGTAASQARVREALAILDSLRIGPAPFSTRLHAARFPRAAAWRTRISGAAHEGRCLRQRTSWASTVPFTDGASNLPPHTMVQHLPPDGIIMAVTQWTDRCRPVEGIPALHPPLGLKHATRMQFPGPRGDELPLYRVTGLFPGRYEVDLWVFYGRRNPTAAQRAAAQRELGGVRWPARL